LPGDERWSFTVGGGTPYSTPAIAANGTLYIGSDDHKLYALDGTSGAKKWEFTTAARFPLLQPLGLTEPSILAQTTTRFYALDGTTGAKRWEFETGDVVYSSPAISADGTIYVGSGGKSGLDNSLYALDATTGTKKWAFATGGGVHSSPAIDVDGTIYFGSRDRKVYGLDPTGTKSGSSRLAIR
jgi:outer membrane protein assembly factor BamB